MAKGQKRSTREKKKPKADKPKSTVQSSPYSTSPGMAKSKGAASKKDR